MDTQTIQQLQELRASLSRKHGGFPLDYCRISSDAVNSAFGFKTTFGLFIDNQGIGHGHHWNLTPQGQVVDITATQFEREIPNVYVVDNDSLEVQKHYLEGVYYMI